MNLKLLTIMICVCGLMLAGCSTIEPPVAPNWDECVNWDICEISERNEVNASIKWCHTMDKRSAEWAWDMGRRNGATLSAKCKYPLTIKQVQING